MATQLTITDSTATRVFRVFEEPIVSAPIINETDVQTKDGNISTYYSSTKRSLVLRLGFMSAADYNALAAFRDRQYTNLKYPVITITNNSSVSIQSMTAKMTLAEKNIVDNFGNVADVEVTFRESKQI